MEIEDWNIIFYMQINIILVVFITISFFDEKYNIKIDNYLICLHNLSIFYISIYKINHSKNSNKIIRKYGFMWKRISFFSCYYLIYLRMTRGTLNDRWRVGLYGPDPNHRKLLFLPIIPYFSIPGRQPCCYKTI